VDYTEGIIRNTEFFTTSELAKKLKMNVQVITRKVQSGDIRAYKIGKDWRIPEPSVHAWLEQRSNDAVGSTYISIESEQSVPKGSVSQPSPRTKLLYGAFDINPNAAYAFRKIISVLSQQGRFQDIAELARKHAEYKVNQNDPYLRRLLGMSSPTPQGPPPQGP